MSEVWLRLTVLATVILSVVVVAIFAERQRSRPGRRIQEVDLAPGVYFFSSASCLECGPARQALMRSLGGQGFREIRWEDEPAEFEALAVTVVPATLWVRSSDDAILYPGSPESVLKRFNP